MVKQDEQQETNIKIVKTMLEKAGQMEFAQKYLAEDVVLHVAPGMPYGRDYIGWQGYMDVIGEVMSFWSEISFGPDHEFAATGNKVVMISSMKGRCAQGGNEVSQPFVETWEIRDGKVTHITPFYYDTAAIATAGSHL